MGDVFLGVQRGAVDFSRLVVIKRIHDNYQEQQYSEEHARMFFNEASVVASLNHPHIVKIYDFCMSGSSPCIVMEYVEGETLKHVFRSCEKLEKQIPLGVACRLILDACDTLRYAHNSTSPTGESRRVIHRDIGLHNLMLDSNGYLKIIDFGIAKSNFHSDLTSPGLIKGNPGYMAPDIFTETIPDHRIDIYALGLCLYELVTQTRAFKFKKDVTVGQIIREISAKDLPPPSRIVSDLPVGMDEVVLKSIAKDRTKRYEDAASFAKDLEAVAGNVLVSGNETKQWFTENFATRLKERREFGAKMLETAQGSNSSQGNLISIPDNVPVSPLNVNSISPTASVMTEHLSDSFSHSVLHPSNLYKLATILFLLFAGCAVVLYLLFFQKSPDREEVAMDNLVVTCDPSEAVLMIDGKELGVIGNEGIAFHVEPNKKHEIVLSKDGYRDYTLPFIGPSSGSKHINAALVKIKAHVADKEKPVSSFTAVEPAQPIDGSDDNAQPIDGPDDNAQPIVVGPDDNAQQDDNEQQVVESEKKKGKRKLWMKKRHLGGAQKTPTTGADSAGKMSQHFSPINEERRKIPLPDDDDRGIILDDEKADAIHIAH